MLFVRSARACSPVLILGLMWFAGVASAHAQASREAELAQQQAEKSKSLGETRRTWLESKLLNIEEAGGFGVQRGFFVAFGDIKSGSGIALGPSYGKTFANGTLVHAKGTYSLRNFKMTQLFVQAPPLASGRLLLNGRARWQDAPELAVHALGIGSPDTRADYAETKTEVSGQALFRPLPLVRLGAGAAFERYETGPSDSRRSSVEELFTAADMPGIGADPDYLHTHVSAALDSRRSPAFSRSGTFIGATLHDYRQRNTGTFSFRRTDATARQLIPVLNGNMVVDLSLRASLTSSDAGETVPFFLMPTLGGGSALRGYDNYRYRDRQSLLVTAEYRWYAQEFLEMALFYDAGKVAARRADLDFDGMKSNVGIGMRLHGPQTTILRMEVARGREGLRLIFAFSPALP